MRHITRQMRAGWLLVLLLLVSVALPGHAREGQSTCTGGPIGVSEHLQRIDLTGCLSYLEDPEHNFTLEDVQAREREGALTAHTDGILNFGYTRSAYWVRFDLLYAGSTAQRDAVLELVLPLADEVTLYQITPDGGRIERHLRYDGDWRLREIAVPNPAFRVELQADVPSTFYLRIYSRNTLRIPLILWSTDSYPAKVAVDEAIQGLFLGSMLAIFAYNLFVTLAVRDRGYMLYSLYLLFATLFVFTEQVHGQQLFNGRPWFLDKELLHFHIWLAWFWGLHMARELLETRTRPQAWGLDHILRLATFAVVTSFVLSLVVDYHVAMHWTVMFSIFLAVLMIFISYRAWKYYNPAARTYFFAWFCTFTGVGIYGITVMGYLPLNTLTAHSPQAGFVAQIILLSFALADRIKLTQREALAWNQRAVANLQRYRALFDNSIEGIFRISTQRRFVEANPSLCGMLGYTSLDELLQVPDALSLCIANAEVRHWVIRQLQQEGAIKGVEAAYVTAKGDQRWANLSIRTVYDMGGQPLYLEGTFVDITERKVREQMEKERESERIEKEMAKSSAAAKSQFLANMSHEIRTPLAAIIGYGESLLDPDLDEEEKRNSAETVVRSGRHLLDLVNDILDHSKIDANKLDVELLNVNLPELLDEVRAFFVPRAREKGVEFFINCEYPLPEMIRTDPTRFRQILINLCGNALKFTDKGSITVAVRCDRERQLIVARVVDTGIGMKPEQMARLFDPFAQGSAAIARQYGGTGLGLSISKRLAELLGGSIRVSSTYGEGSEFEVTLASGPLDHVHFIRDASELTQRRRQITTVQAPRLKGRILCAEDNEVNRKLVDLLVARTGANIVHVGNGAEALEQGTREAFDLILMDIQMPVMNGRDATKALREAGINTPVVALTANVMAEDIQDYREAGCTEFLAKPIDKRRFYDLLLRYLKVDDAKADAAPAQQFVGTVLVAEDNADNLKLVERMLKRRGLEVLSAGSGDVAVQLALAKTVHMILMDSHLPGMDGPVATRLLRQTGFRRPIIAFTAGDEQEVDGLLKAGCDGVLHKPIKDTQLVSLLQKHLAPLDESAQPEPVEDEDDAIRELVTQFLDGLPERQQLMSNALQLQDWDTLRSQAHQIKGTAGAMGYPLMTEQAGRLERALKQGRVEEAQEQLRVLQQQISEALARRARAAGAAS